VLSGQSGLLFNLLTAFQLVIRVAL